MARPARYEFGRRKETYFQATHRPLNCLVFLLPLIVLYEVASLWSGSLSLESAAAAPHAPQFVRAFHWIVQFIGLFTSVPTYLPGLLLLAVLVLWHLTTGARGRVRWQTMAGMAGESVLFCISLLVLSKMIFLSADSSAAAAPAAGATGTAETVFSSLPLLDQLVVAVTAGIYEELIFRLLLIWMFTLLAVDILELPRSESLAGIVVITALLFAGYHYLGGGDPFTWRSFTFRLSAGILLGMVYVLRGFGIVVGAHSLFDIAVTLLATS